MDAIKKLHHDKHIKTAIQCGIINHAFIISQFRKEEPVSNEERDRWKKQEEIFEQYSYLPSYYKENMQARWVQAIKCDINISSIITNTEGMKIMNLKITIISNSITEKDINELNNQNSDCQYTKTAHKGFALSPEIVMIVIELLKNIEYNAAYDIIKTSIISIIPKIPINPKKETRVIVIKGEQKSEIRLPFEVTEEQKNKLVDAAIEQWRM